MSTVFAHVSSEEIHRLDRLNKVRRLLVLIDTDDVQVTGFTNLALRQAEQALLEYLTEAIGSATQALRVFQFMVAATPCSEAWTLGTAYAFGWVGSDIEAEWAKADAMG